MRRNVWARRSRPASARVIVVDDKMQQDYRYELKRRAHGPPHSLAPHQRREAFARREAGETLMDIARRGSSDHHAPAQC